MNLQDLRYFVAVAEHRHFGRAAESCHISQPTLSSQIRKLEDELGVILLERTNKRVNITPGGAPARIPAPTRIARTLENDSESRSRKSLEERCFLRSASRAFWKGAPATS